MSTHLRFYVQDEEHKFPPNYATLLNILKLLPAVLVILGVRRINRLQEKRERHKWANKIMDKMVESGTNFLYLSGGTIPVGYWRPFLLPLLVPVARSTDEVLVWETPSSDASKKPQSGIPILMAAKTGIVEMVKKIHKTFPMEIQETDQHKKNALLLAIENRQAKVLEFLLTAEKVPEFVFKQVDSNGNSARHLAGMKGPANSWVLPSMYGESSWFKYVHNKLPKLHYAQNNTEGKTPREVFQEEHEELRKEAADWLMKTSESCSVVAALIATVAFATSITVPGGVDDKTGHPLLEQHPLFHLFSVSSLVALGFSLTSLVFFLSIITSKCQVWDFAKKLPQKLLMGLSCLLISIAAILVSFCAGHFFILNKDLKPAVVPIYTVASAPLTIFAFSNFRLYYDLVRALCAKAPRHSY